MRGRRRCLGLGLGFRVYSHVWLRVVVERVGGEGASAPTDPQMCCDVAHALKNDGNKLMGLGFSYRALHKCVSPFHLRIFVTLCSGTSALLTSSQNLHLNLEDQLLKVSRQIFPLSDPSPVKPTQILTRYAASCCQTPQHASCNCASGTQRCKLATSC